MSEEDRIKSRRTIEERVWVHWPSMARRTMRRVLRLPPGSRVRRAMLRRAARIIFLSWNRGDFALVPSIDDPEVETRLTVGSNVVMGVDPVYYGPEGHCRVMEDWNEAWQEWDAEIEEIIEEGRDQVLFIARVSGVGAASGIKVDEWSAARYTFREGRILRIEGALHSEKERALKALAAIS
jgi:ketosteroid isomerase-like protein